jgi:hypothetical protein
MVTFDPFATRMPSKFAPRTVNPEMTTLATPGVGVAATPLTKMPFDFPLALMTGSVWGAATSESDYVMVTCSLYVPWATTIVSPAEAAATAAEIVDLHPNLPFGWTQRIAAEATLLPVRESAARINKELRLPDMTVRRTFDFDGIS